uniref:5MP1/2-like HEAT domain-containing protein n=1 Tax=Cyanistes caeruleus TaxID=156563 RepID=A0A8C0UDB3_CYACU
MKSSTVSSREQKPAARGCIKARTSYEKEKFEPTVFRDTIVQGLNEAGNDLEAIAKFLDAAGSRLDYRRYADTLFDILVAGSMLDALQVKSCCKSCFVDVATKGSSGK